MKETISLIFLVAFIAIMLLGGCSGGTRQRTILDEDGNITDIPVYQDVGEWE